MQRLWVVVVLVLLVPLAYVKGKTSVCCKQSPAVEPAKPSPEVTADQPAHPWVHKHHLALDPVVLLVVMALSGAASAFFGWQIWQVNQRQMQIQATQALPLFEAHQELVRNVDGEVMTDWLYIHNKGGLARNTTIEIEPLLTLVIRRPPGDNILIDDIPVAAYTYASVSHVPPGSWSDETVQLGDEGNAARVRRQLNDMASPLENSSELTYEVGYVSWLLTISYQDYQGNDRTEYYGYRPGINPYTEPPEGEGYELSEHGSFGALSLQDVQSRESAARWNSDHGLSLPIPFNSRPFVEALLTDPRLEVPPSGPVASPSAGRAASPTSH